VVAAFGLSPISSHLLVYILIMSTHHYTIRTATRQEIDLLVGWAAAEGWNPGVFDADCFYTADSEGFFLGCLDDEPIASLSAVKYGNDFAFIGFYIVKPDYRSRGFGLQIWNTVLTLVKDRNAALDGVVAQQENYKKFGFRTAHRNIRYAGVGGGEFLHDEGLVELGKIPFEQVVAYDAAFFPGDRSRFIQQWVKQPHSAAFGVLADGQLIGYGMVRPSQTGYRIGPFFADSEAVAETLFLAFKSQVPTDTPFYLDVPEPNAAALRLVERYGMTPVFETARMYTKEIPELPLGRWFGVTTLEIG